MQVPPKRHVTASSSGRYDGSEGGNQVSLYVIIERPHREEVGVDGWLNRTLDFNMGDQF